MKSFSPLMFALIAALLCSQAYGQSGFKEADANEDKKIDAKELEEYATNKLNGFDKFKQLFKAMDVDNDGSISEEEFANRRAAVRKVVNSPAETKKKDDPRQNPRRRRNEGLKVGQVAPTFKLKSLDGKSETDLASFKGKKPVVLIFGSYT